MPERITLQAFHDADGTADWREVGVGACAVFRTGSFAAGLELVARIGELAEAMDHHPDVHLRYPDVHVRLITHDVDGLSDLDVALAGQISEAARALGAAADPSRVQTVQLTMDVAMTDAVRPFWAAVLGYDEVGDADALDPRGLGPGIWFQDMEPTRTERNRLHIDVFVPHDVAAARVAAAVAAGGRIIRDAEAPMWWTLADPEGNEVDVATWQGRD